MDLWHCTEDPGPQAGSGFLTECVYHQTEVSKEPHAELGTSGCPQGHVMGSQGRGTAHLPPHPMLL